MATIDYFFGIGSPWSFLGLDPLVELADRFALDIRPIVIPLIEENGAIYSRNRPEARRAYWFADLKRWAAVRGKSLALDNRGGLSDPTPAGYLVIAAILEGQDWVRLTRSLQSAFWEQAQDIGQPDVRKTVADAAGFDGAGLQARAEREDVVATWRQNYETAKAAGVFGLPTFRLDGELYWGQDSLPFLKRHLQDGRPVA